MAYQYARVRKIFTICHSITLIRDTNSKEGVFRYLFPRLLSKRKRKVPFCRDWFATEFEAKKVCREQLGVKIRHWKTRIDGSPMADGLGEA